MNGFDSEMLIEDIDDSAEYDESDLTELAEDDEAAEFLPFPPFLRSPFGGPKGKTPTAPGQGYYKTPPPPAFVTQAQLKSALERVQKDVRINSEAVKSLTTRLATVQAVQSRHTKELAKQNAMNAKQAKAIAAVRAEAKKAREMGLIMFLMTRPKATETAATVNTPIGSSGVVLPQGHKVLVAPEKDDSILLPLLLMGGLGGDSGGGDNSMLLALAMSGGLG